MGDEERRSDLVELVELLGSDSLAFLCACSPQQIAERLDGLLLERAQERSLVAVRSLLDSPVVSAPPDMETRRMASASLLAQWDEQTETSLANRLRVLAGGEIPEIDESEPIAAALEHLARDSFVGTLFQGAGPTRPWTMCFPIFSPWNEKLQKAVLADEQIGAIFNGLEDGNSSSFELWSSTGRGEGGVQLSMLGQRLLSTPAAMARAQVSTIREFMADAKAAIADMRALVAGGESVEVKALHGLDGLRLPVGTEITTRWGVLRRLGEHEEELVLEGYKGSGNAVIETTYPVRLSITTSGKGAEDPFPADLASHRGKAEAHIQEAARMIGLAVILAKDLSMPAHIGPRFSLIAEPFAWAPALWGRGPLRDLSIPVELTSQDVEAVEKSMILVERGHHDRASVAIARTISAHERIDPTDAFVDALIAWDALFGSPSGDAVVFRVATGFALLLGEDEDARRQVKKRAQELYRLRSAVVHGTVQRLDWAEAESHRREAVEMLVRALRLLYRREPELLGKADRTNELLMRRGIASRGTASS
jgi:hypothetical protein